MSWQRHRARAGALAQRWTEPAPAITDGEERRHARALSVVTLCFTALVVVIGWVPVVFYGVAGWRVGVWLATGAGFAVALVLSRTVHTRLSAWLIVAVLACSIALALVGSEPEAAAVTLVFLALPVSIAAVVLRFREAVAFAVATVAAAAATAETALDVPGRLAAPALLFLVLGTTLVFLVVEVRRRDQRALQRHAQELAESREGFRSLFDDSIVALLLHEHGELIAANQAFADLLGYDRTADLVGKSVLDLVAAEYRETAARRLTANDLSTDDVVLIRRDGGLVTVESRAKPLVYEGRTVRLSAVRDITAEREAHERLRMALEAGRMRTWEWGLQENTVVWTGGEPPVQGAELGVALLEDVFLALVHVDDRTVLQEALERAVLAGQDYEAEYRIVHPDGSVEWTSESGRPVYDEGGRPVRIVGVSRVTSDQKSAQAALRVSEERYRELFENAHDVVATTDAELRLTSINRAGEALLGQPRSELLGRRVSDFVAPEYHELMAEQYRRKLRGEVGATAYELEAITADARRVPLEVSTRLILDGERPGGIHTTMRDISRRRVLENQLRQAQRLEVVGRLAGGIAHDFNNILTAIDGFNDLLLNSLDPDDARRFDALEVKRAAERAADLTRQLLAFSRLQVLQPRVLDLNDVVRDLESLLRRTLGEDVSLETAFSGDACRVVADRGQLDQVLINLAVNARDAMPHGGRLEVTTVCVTLAGPVAETLELPPGEYIELTVRDTGVGMDEVTLAQVFEPFFTTKPSGEGTGLGLATAYGIVRQSGGQIRVESELGRGSSFHVLLPAAPAGEDVPAGLREREGSENGSETLLLVEDEDMVRRLARLTLEQRGYRVLEAAGGDEALRLAAEFDEPIHLLLTDVVMPGMNGRALAEHLQAKRPETRVLFMSGYPDDAIVRYGISEADVAFLEKPFSSGDLAEKVREVLDAA